MPGRCSIAQQTVTYLFKFGSDKFDVRETPWAQQSGGPGGRDISLWTAIEQARAESLKARLLLQITTGRDSRPLVGVMSPSADDGLMLSHNCMRN